MISNYTSLEDIQSMGERMLLRAQRALSSLELFHVHSTIICLEVVFHQSFVEIKGIVHVDLGGKSRGRFMLPKIRRDFAASELLPWLVLSTRSHRRVDYWSEHLMQ